MTLITISGFGVDFAALAVNPRDDLDRVRDKTRHSALHQRIVSENDVLLANIRLIGLDNHWK